MRQKPVKDQRRKVAAAGRCPLPDHQTNAHTHQRAAGQGRNQNIAGVDRDFGGQLQKQREHHNAGCRLNDGISAQLAEPEHEQHHVAHQVCNRNPDPEQMQKNRAQRRNAAGRHLIRRHEDVDCNGENAGPENHKKVVFCNFPPFHFVHHIPNPLLRFQPFYYTTFSPLLQPLQKEFRKKGMTLGVMPFVFSLVLAGLCSRLGVCDGIQLLVAEIERHVNRDFDEIQHVVEEAQVEQESAAPAGDLNYLSDDAAGIADEQEDLKEQALALGGAGNDGFADGNRPGQTETEDGQCFQ